MFCYTDERKPAVGQGLNTDAEVTLFNVYKVRRGRVYAATPQRGEQLTFSLKTLGALHYTVHVSSATATDDDDDDHATLRLVGQADRPAPPRWPDDAQLGEETAQHVRQAGRQVCVLQNRRRRVEIRGDNFFWLSLYIL